MSSVVITELKNLHLKYLNTDIPSNVNLTQADLLPLNSTHSDIVLFEAMQEIAANQRDKEALPFIYSLYNFFKSNPLSEDTDELDTPEEFSDIPSTEYSEELSDEEETFTSKYPQVDTETILLSTYRDWILGVKGKPFFKTLVAFYEDSQAGLLNFTDRIFLWKFIKAISSCLTHLFIEGEQREEALCLVDKYYDSLIHCLNSVVHAADKEDVISSFQYMVDFLGISKKPESEEKESEDLDEFK